MHEYQQSGDLQNALKALLLPRRLGAGVYNFHNVTMEEQHQNAEAQPMPKPMIPHAYPIIIRVIVVSIGLAVLYGIVSLPKYVEAIKNVKAAKAAFISSDFSSAATMYLKVLEKVPSSRIARVGAAKSFFATKTRDDDQQAVGLLEGLVLYESEMNELSKVMPPEYQQYFEQVPVKQ